MWTLDTQDGATNDNDQEPLVESLDQIAVEHEWNRLLLRGPPPLPRSKHAAVAVGRKMFVTGGTSPQGILTDVQVFHAEKLTWDPLGHQSSSTGSEATQGERNDAPYRSCTGHSLVYWDKQFVIVGCQPKSASKTVTVFSLNLSSRSWSTLSPKGNAPSARTGHTVVQMADMLVLFGGEDLKGHTLNDIHVLVLKTLLWLPMETSGTKPSPRRDHCAANSERYLWIFGGKSKTTYYNDTYCLDFKNMDWIKGKTKGKSPIPRAGHSGIVAGNKWYIVGGESKGNELLTTLTFNLETQEWSEFANIRSGSPLANDGISLVKIQSKRRIFAVAFGGHHAKPSNLANQIYAMLLPSPQESSLTMSDTSSGHSNSFDSEHSVQPVVRRSMSPQSVRPSNASGGGGSPESTFSLEEIILRSGRESSVGGVDDQEVANLLRNNERILTSQAFSITSTANDEEEYQTAEESHDERQRLAEEVHPVHMEEKLSSPASNLGDVNNEGSLGFVPTHTNLDPNPPNGSHDSEISGDLNERLLAALKLNEDLQNRLLQTHNDKLELEDALEKKENVTNDLEQQVWDLVMSKADGEWKLEETRKKLEEMEKKMNSPSRVHQDSHSKIQSTSKETDRLTRPNSLRTKLFEESIFTDETDVGYELHRRLEEAESKLINLSNSHHLIESKLQTATREKRELSENAATAMQMMEEARLACKTLRAENLQLKQDLLAVRAILADTKEELQAKQVELAQATARNFELKVEMHELSHKFSGS